MQTLLKKLFLIFCMVMLCMPVYADRAGPSRKYKAPGQIDGQALSREESEKALDPMARQLLDNVLEFRSKPGLFSNRDEIFKKLGVVYFDRVFRNGNYIDYYDEFIIINTHAGNTWLGYYTYFSPHEYRDLGVVWFASLDIEILGEKECINSRAVEGYLGLPLQPSIGMATKTPLSYFSKRHTAIYDQVSIASDHDHLPDVYISYAKGCLKKIIISNTFNPKEVSHENSKQNW